MGIRTVALCVAAGLGGAAALPGPASAIAPPNDNYLASRTIGDPGGPFPPSWRDSQTTVEATTQADLFNPDREGAELRGGPPETTRCGSTSYGKTVWYDISPPISGGVELIASGYDTVISVYEYDVETAKILRRVACLNDSSGTTEDLALPTSVLKDHHYTVQVGGAASAAGFASGTLDFSFRFRTDRDSDEVLDAEPDQCLELPGIPPSGCPPELKAIPSYNWARAGSGIRLTRLVVLNVPSAGRVEAECSRCGLRQVVKAKAGRSTVRLSKFVGPTLPVGGTLQMRVTKAAAGKGRYRHGAIGRYFRYKIVRDGLGPRLDRCLLPGSERPRTCT